MDLYAVVGNPIEHSLSPQIHSQFAQQTNQAIEYQALKLEQEQFEDQVRELQQQGYRGLNVTVPFKEKAWHLADRLSPRAQDAKAVNTLFFQDDGKIIGDNTDGMGLSRDLIINHEILIPHRKILILGAGGAVRGVLGPILARKPGMLTIANRTLSRAEQLAKDFFHIGEIQACDYDQLGRENFDLIINGTSAGLSDEIPPVPDEVLGPNSVCYDMMYSLSKPTAFVEWAQHRGALRAYDGLGMLVEQAAEAFYVWRGLRPDTASVIEQLRKSG